MTKKTYFRRLSRHAKALRQYEKSNPNHPELLRSQTLWREAVDKWITTNRRSAYSWDRAFGKRRIKQWRREGKEE